MSLSSHDRKKMPKSCVLLCKSNFRYSSMSIGNRFVTSQYRVHEQVSEDACHRSKQEGKLFDLKTWLYPSTDNQILFRYAPSIILRSELELLGLCKPRFAIRAYLTSRSFVNLRRLKVTAQALQKRYALVGRSELGLKLAIQVNEGESQWIADSLLEPPTSPLAAGKFECITTRLATYYGEPDEFEAVPYVKHMSLGGGMCAQAAAFMALGLANSKQYLGISELSRIVSRSTKQIPIDGLDQFELAGLLSHQRFGTCATLQAIPADEPQSKRTLDNILRAYLRSKIPVVLIVSLSRVAGQHNFIPQRIPKRVISPILDRSNQTIRSLFSETAWNWKFPSLDLERKDHHSVVVVGRSIISDIAHSSFLINDPATLPFLPATAEQLLDARRYDPDSIESINAPKRIEILNQSESLRGQMKWLEILPVTPAGINNTLAPNVIGDRVALGLLDTIESAVQQSDNPVGLFYEPDSCLGENIVLFKKDGDYASKPQVEQDLKKVRKRAGFAGDDQSMQVLLEKLGPSWHWMYTNDKPDRQGKSTASLWFWSATTRDQSYSALKLVFAIMDGKWQQVFPRQN